MNAIAILAEHLAQAPELALVALLEALRLARRGSAGWSLEEMKRLSGASRGVLLLVGLRIASGGGVSLLLALAYCLRVAG